MRCLLPVLAAAVLLCLCSSAWAIESLTLEQAIDEAENTSPDVQKGQAIEDKEDAGKLKALSGFLPHLTLSANHDFNPKFQVLNVNFGAPIAFAEVYPYSTFQLDATLPIFDGFSNINNAKSAWASSQAGRLQNAWTRFKVHQDVTIKFYQAVAAQELAIVADQNIKTLEDHLARVQTLLRAGAATKFDVLRVQVQLNDARSERVQAYDNVAMTRKTLAQSMGLDQDGRPLDGHLPQPSDEKVQRIANVSDKNVDRPDIHSAQLQAKAAHQRAVAAKGFWYPHLNLNGQYQVYNNTDEAIDPTSSNFANAYFVGASLTWNLFDGGDSIARSQQAAAQAQVAEATARQAELSLPHDVEYWKRRYVYSNEVYKAKTSDVTEAEEAVRLAKLGFRAGTRTTTEVLDAELDLFKARAGLVNAETNAVEAWTNLEMAIGHVLQ